MNRKGNYPLMLVIVVFVCCIWLVINVNEVFTAVPFKFGELQEPVLSLGGDMRLVESQLELSSEYSIREALSGLPSSPLLGRGCGFGHVSVSVDGRSLYCPVLNDPEILSEKCTPDYLSGFNSLFNEGLASYLDRYGSQLQRISYPRGSFVVSPFPSYSAVVSTDPVFFSLYDASDNFVGNASFRPAFKVDQLSVQGYPSMLSSMHAIIDDCYDSSDVSSCISVPSGAEWREVDGVYAVIYPYDFSPVCFAANLGYDV